MSGMTFTADVCRCQLLQQMGEAGNVECPVHTPAILPVSQDLRWESTNLVTDDITARSSLEEISGTKKVKDEVGRYFEMLKLIVPLAIVGFLLHIPTVVTSVLCGQLNSTQSQSAASLAMSTSNYVGFSFILGILTAYESLGSQALGAGKRSRLGLLTVRSIVISLVISCYVAIIWFFSENIFNLVTSTKPTVDKEAGFTLRVFSISLPFFCVDSVLTKYLIISGNTIEAVLIRLLAVITHVILSYVTVFTLELGLVGAGVTLIVTEVLSTVAVSLVVKHLRLDGDILENANYEAFKGWGTLLKLGVPGIIMVLTQSLSLEGVILLLSVDNILMYDAFLQLLQYHQLYFHLYHGFTVAGAIVTGKNVGSQDYVKAKKDTQYFSGFVFLAGSMFAIFTMLLRYQITYMLSETVEVEAIMRGYIYIYSLYLVIDCTQVSLSGVLRGLGKQRIGAVIYSSYFVVAIVTAYLLVEKFDMEGFGAWEALVIGSSCALAGLGFVVYRIDWVLEVNRSLENLGLINRNLVHMRTLQTKDNRSSSSGANLHDMKDRDVVLVESESAPLFKKADTWNTCDNEARLCISISLLSVSLVVVIVLIYFLFLM